MNLIVLLFFSSLYCEGNLHLVDHSKLLPKLHADLSNDESYEIQTMKKTLLGEKQIKLKPQETTNTPNTDKLPQLSVQNNNPRHRIKYTKNKSHTLEEPSIHIDTENAIIDYEKNDTTATQRQLVEIESMIIKHSTDETSLLDSSLYNEDYNDKSIDENMNNTRRLIADTNNLPRYEFDIPSDENLLQNNQSIELKDVNADTDPLMPNDDNNDRYSDEFIASSSSSSLNDLNDTLKDSECTDTDDSEPSEKTDSEVFKENLRKNIPTSGRGITDMVKSRMMLISHPRACYACNSIRDPSCWTPNRSTSVKYCRRDHYYCITKVFDKGGYPQVIRDCGDSCFSASTVATGEAYASCTVCQSDLCNSAAGGLEIQNIVSIVIIAMSIMVGVSKSS